MDDGIEVIGTILMIFISIAVPAAVVIGVFLILWWVAVEPTLIKVLVQNYILGLRGFPT